MYEYYEVYGEFGSQYFKKKNTTFTKKFIILILNLKFHFQEFCNGSDGLKSGTVFMFVIFLCVVYQ